MHHQGQLGDLDDQSVRRQAEWDLLIEDAYLEAERKLGDERTKAQKRAVQLGREQGYHRLAVAIERPRKDRVGAGQLSFFPSDPTLFDA